MFVLENSTAHVLFIPGEGVHGMCLVPFFFFFARAGLSTGCYRDVFM